MNINMRLTLYESNALMNYSRFIWNFFRLENEHLNNCGEFRAVRDISIAPIDAGDQAKIIKMMDDSSAVVHHRPKRQRNVRSSALPAAIHLNMRSRHTQNIHDEH